MLSTKRKAYDRLFFQLFYWQSGLTVVIDKFSLSLISFPLIISREIFYFFIRRMSIDSRFNFMLMPFVTNFHLGRRKKEVFVKMQFAVSFTICVINFIEEVELFSTTTNCIFISAVDFCKVAFGTKALNVTFVTHNISLIVMKSP